MHTSWKTIPLFISSTFRDLHAERDELSHVVFPALAERLKARHCRLEPIDLRLGVETDQAQPEEERERQILKVCLAEIERSRPFLLVLLGERYGWVPGRERLRAAGEEAGYTPPDEDGSVTALEIEYGLLRKDPAQRRRCLLCLREPLPVERMPAELAAIYSEARATDPGAPDRARRLAALKARIQQDPELEGHRLSYTLDWDERRQQPAVEGERGLRAWGRAVEAALWELLDEETAAHAARAEPTWEDEERFAVEEQVERLGAGFVGRTALLEQAKALALSPAAEGAPWGLCVTGASGSGKSALFARLHQDLHQLLAAEPDLLLLSHAAGVSPRAGQVEWMLRRWVGELGTAIGETPALPEELKPEELEAAFRQWLHRATATRRVVLLVDALNQFSGERARSLSWLPTIWPANARFIATAIPGTETESLTRRPGAGLLELRSLDLTEAADVAAQVYARYHRTPNAEVLRELLARRTPEGLPAAGHPLWLSMALDLLNQLDGDDFQAAETSLESTDAGAGERLRRFVVARARALPVSVEGLYHHLLARVEKLAGTGETRALAALIALSRQGWSEDDLRHLLPRAADLLAPGDAPHAWDDLRFAVLRRGFRAHLVKRGAREQWDLAHATFRQTVRPLLEQEWRADATPEHEDRLAQALHALGADHLECLDPDDGTDAGELMWQMLGTGDAPRVARRLFEQAMIVPTANCRVVGQLLCEESAEGRPLRAFVLSLLDSGEAEQQGYLAKTFIFGLNDALKRDGPVALRSEVLERSRDALARLLDMEPTHKHRSSWRRDLATCHYKTGDLQIELGEVVGAKQSYESANRFFSEQMVTNPTVVHWQRDNAVTLVRLGDICMGQGDLDGALRAFQDVLRTHERLAADDPSNPLSQRDLGIVSIKLGEVHLAMGDLAKALQYFHASESRFEHLCDTEPDNLLFKLYLSVSQLQIGTAQKALGDYHAALSANAASLGIFELLVAREPGNALWRRDLGLRHQVLGDVYIALGELDAARKSIDAALVIAQGVAELDPGNTNWQRDLCNTFEREAELNVATGDHAGALRAINASMPIRKRLALLDPTNLRWQLDLGICCSKSSDANRVVGNLDDALRDAKAALEVLRGLVAAEPANLSWRAHLFYSMRVLSKAQRDLGELEVAEHTALASMEVVDRLVAADPSNAIWQRALASCYWNMAEIHERLGTSRSVDWWHKAMQVFLGMQAAGKLDMEDAKSMLTLKEKLGPGDAVTQASSTGHNVD